MKFSMCSTSKKNDRLEDIIEYARSLGLEGIEIWDGHIDEYLERNSCAIDKLFELLNQREMKCVAIAPYFNFLDEGNVTESLRCVRKCVEYAKGLQCGIIRTFLGYKASAELTDDEWDICLNSLKTATELGEENGIYFALETHNNQPADTKEAVIRIINSVNSPFLKVLFDGFNYYLYGLDMMEAYHLLEPYIIHYHMKNYRWDQKICTPLNKGDVDFTPLIRAVNNSGYGGFVSFEVFCDDQSEIIRENLKWIDSI